MLRGFHRFAVGQLHSKVKYLQCTHVRLHSVVLSQQGWLDLSPFSLWFDGGHKVLAVNGQNHNLLHPNNSCNFANSQSCASKGRGRKSFGNEEEEFSDDEDQRVEDSLSDGEGEQETGLKTWKDLSVNTSSLRIDAILSSGLGISRKKIEDAFLEARLLQNGKVISKKSKLVKIGDVIDVALKEKHQTSEDQDGCYAVMMRVKILKIEEELTSKNRVPVRLRRWKYLEILRS